MASRSAEIPYSHIANLSMEHRIQQLELRLAEQERVYAGLRDDIREQQRVTAELPRDMKEHERVNAELRGDMKSRKVILDGDRKDY